MNEEDCSNSDKPLYELVQEPPLREYVQLGSAANAALAAAAMGEGRSVAMRINTPTHEAMGDSTNTTLATKKKKGTAFGRVFVKYVSITQPKDLDWCKTSKEELNLLVIGVFSGCSAYDGGEDWSGPKYWKKNETSG
jgi:hypothetical protein